MRCLSGNLVYEPETGGEAEPFMQRLAAVGLALW